MFCLRFPLFTAAQVRLGTQKDTQGTAFVVFEDIFDAKKACEHLSGFNVGNRYIVVLYYDKQRMESKKSRGERKAELEQLKAAHNL